MDWKIFLAPDQMDDIRVLTKSYLKNWDLSGIKLPILRDIILVIAQTPGMN